jgi:hypothetical protein
MVMKFGLGSRYGIASTLRVALGVLILVLAVPSVSFAQSPFDGTWKDNPNQSKFSPKPLESSLSNGAYDCISCAPKVHVKADGSDQVVSGQAYDTLAVKEVDARTVQFVAKKNGKTSWEQTRTVSEDGKTQTIKTTSYPPNSTSPVTAEAVLEREGKTPAGAHAISGSWKLKKMSESENALISTYKASGDELTMTTSTGGSWTAKLDGKDYPVKGSYNEDTVSLKKINDHEIEESYKRGGTLIEVDKVTVSADGKTMTIVSEAKLTGRVSTFVSTKQ